MTHEEAFQAIQSELDVSRELRLSGAMEEATVRLREEDLNLSKVLIEQNREDAETVMTALELQSQSIEDGVTPIPRLLRIIREIKSSETEPEAPAPPAAPVIPPPAEMIPPPQDEELRDFRAELPDTSMRKNEIPMPPDEPTEATMPVPEDPPRHATPPSRTTDRRGGSSSRLRRRPPMASPEREEPPVRKSKAPWIVLGLLVLLGGAGGGAFFVLNKPGGSSSPAMEEARKLLLSAEKERANGTPAAPALFEKAQQSFSNVIRIDTKLAEAYEGRAQARWRLASGAGKADIEALNDCESALKLEPTRPVAKTLRGLCRLMEMVRTNGGWEPLPGRLLQATLLKVFPTYQPFLTGADAMPAQFGKYSEPSMEPIRGDLRAGTEVKGEHPIAALAAKILRRFESSSDPVQGETEELLCALGAAKLPFAEGRRAITEALVHSADSVVLLQTKAYILAAEGRFEEAFESVRTLIARDDSNGTGLVIKAAVSLSRGQPRPALEDLEKAAQKGEKSPLLRALKCAATLLTASNEVALAELEAVYEEVPLTIFRWERGMHAMAAGQATKAREDLRAAVNAIAANPRVVLMHAFCLWALGDPDATVNECLKVQQMKPDPDTAFEAMELAAMACMAKGDEARGMEAFVKAAQIKKQPPMDFLLRWEFYLRMNNDWKNVKDLAIAFAPMPGSNGVHFLVAQIDAATSMEEWEDVIRLVQKVLDLKGDLKVEPKNVLGARIGAYEKLGKYQELIEDVNLLLSKQPDAVGLYGLRAFCKVRLGQWKEARDDADKAIAEGADPRNLALAYLTQAVNCARDSVEDPEEYRAVKKEKMVEYLQKAVSGGMIRPAEIPTDGPLSIYKDSPEFRSVLGTATEQVERAKRENKAAPFMGIQMATTTDGRVQVSGTYKDSAARKACLQTGDVIIEFNNEPVRKHEELSAKIKACTPGMEITVKFERTLAGPRKIVQIRKMTLGDRTLMPDK